MTHGLSKRACMVPWLRHLQNHVDNITASLLSRNWSLFPSRQHDMPRAHELTFRTLAILDQDISYCETFAYLGLLSLFNASLLRPFIRCMLADLGTRTIAGSTTFEDVRSAFLNLLSLLAYGA